MKHRPTVCSSSRLCRKCEDCIRVRAAKLEAMLRDVVQQTDALTTLRILKFLENLK